MFELYIKIIHISELAGWNISWNHSTRSYYSTNQNAGEIVQSMLL